MESPQLLTPKDINIWVPANTLIIDRGTCINHAKNCLLIIQLHFGATWIGKSVLDKGGNERRAAETPEAHVAN